MLAPPDSLGASADGSPSPIPGGTVPLSGLAPQQALPPPVKYYNVTVRKRTTYGHARVMAVPPEEWGISPRSRCIKEADYSCHGPMPRAVHELISAGYDPEQVKGLQSYSDRSASLETWARDSQNEEDRRASDTINEMTRQVEITEHYLRMDYDGTGAKLWKITTGGEGYEILRCRKDDDSPYEDDIEEIDVVPFAAMTPVTIPHRVIGRSVADLVMEIQKIKTAIKRSLLDNAYVSILPRPVVSESSMTENTLDDLLTWRPGAPIRVRDASAVVFQQIPSVGNIVYPLLDRLDYEMEARTGFTKNQGLDPNVLQNMPATNANLMANAAQQRIKLIARIFAETGIRDLFLLLHQVIRKNDRMENTVRLRGQWVPVDPRQWKTRTDMTVNVGLGTGSKDQQLIGLMSLGADMEKILQAPQLNLVSRQQVYEYEKEKCKLLGYKNPDRFFMNPATTPEGQPPPNPEDKKIQLEMLKAQMQDQREKTQAQADIATQQFKVQSELALKREEFRHKVQLETLQAQAEIETKRQTAAAKIAGDAASARIKTEQEAQRHAMDMQQREEAHRASMMQGQQSHDSLGNAISQLTQAVSRPRKVVRHPKTGRVEGLN